MVLFLIIVEIRFFFFMNLITSPPMKVLKAFPEKVPPKKIFFFSFDIFFKAGPEIPIIPIGKPPPETLPIKVRSGFILN